MPYSIEQIVPLVQAERHGNRAAHIDWLLTDSRSLCFPEETLFFALKTNRGDGQNYLPELYARGVRNFVTHTLPMATQSCSFADANFLLVADPLQALQNLAQRHRNTFHMPVIGITGSNGKTIVKEWLAQILSKKYHHITRSPRSYNSQIGVPLSIWQLKENDELGLFEAGISQVGEMKRLASIVSPTLGILTNIGDAHQENFKSKAQKCAEKLELFKNSKTLIYNADDKLIITQLGKAGLKAQLLGWSFYNADAPLFIKRVERTDEFLRVFYFFKNEKIEGCYTIPFTDEASLENSIHCLAAALLLGLTPEMIAERMEKLEPVAMRLEVKEGKNGCIIINDSYNSDLASLDIALNVLHRRSEGKGLHRTVILSDLQQTGESPKSLYNKVAQLIENRGVHKLIGIGQHIVQGDFQMEHYFFPTTEAFLASDVFTNLHDEIILLKGSRKFRFEEISELLELRVHETILEINLDAIVDNVNHFRSFLRPETKMICMVKASAYGAGSKEVAKTLQDHRIDYLAVAVADEGSALRKAGITANIIIMNPEMSSFQTLFDYRLEPEVYNFRLLEAMITAAEHQGITHYPIHIKIDTGMHRMGFNPDELPKLIELLKGQNAVLPRSVFSHLVGSDSPKFDDFTLQQIAIFDHASSLLQNAFSHKILRHILNSAGIERFPAYQYDMVRLGIGLYGVSAIDNSIINNVSTLRTTILQIREVPASDTVGYSRKGVLTRTSRIADIPIGYADGLDRHLGNRHACCFVNGQPAPYIGNICMDVAMIDVTDIPCKEGDSVVIFGKEQPVTVLSDLLDTIPYEILTSVSDRVKRVYFQEN